MEREDRIIRRKLSATRGGAVCLFAALMLAAGTAAAEDNKTRGWHQGSSKNGSLEMADLVPQLGDGEAYSERYIFSTDFDDGGHVGVDFTISNLGWGDGNGASAVRVELPGDAGHYKFSKMVDSDSWSYGKKSFSLDIADTSVRGKGKGTFLLSHDGKLDGKKLEVRLELVNRVPMWQPGNGSLRVGEEGYYRYHIIAPRADVTGTIVHGDKTYKIAAKRGGYADHTTTNMAPFDLASRFGRFRATKGDLFVSWREIKLGEKHGGGSMTWVVVAYRDQIVFSDPDAKLSFARVKRDKKTGYTVPFAVKIEGEQGKNSIELFIKAKKFDKTDLLASYGKAAKMVASAVSKPFRYDMSGTFVLKMDIGGTKATVRSGGHYVFDYMKK
jgi:hypothetical protein